MDTTHLTIGMAPESTPAPEAPRDGSVYTLHSDNGIPTEIKRHAVTKFQAADLATSGVGGILGTARNPHTMGPTTRINDDTVVHVNGLDMRIRQAVQQGFLERTEGGIYREPGRTNAATATQQVEPKVQNAPAPDPLEAEIYTAHAAIVDALPESILEANIARIIAGGVEAADLQSIRASGMDDGQFRAHAETVFGGLALQAGQMLERHGINPEDFRAWAEKNARQEFQRARRDHYTSGSADVYGRLAQRYIAHVPPSTEAIRKGGLRTWIDHITKREMVEVHGMKMTVAAAARAGHI